MTVAAADFETRGYRSGDETEILRLFALSFGHQRSLAHWRWKYVENPWGHHRISLTFDPEGRLVAHYAGYPVPWLEAGPAGSGDLLSLQIGDTMTAAGVRHIGRGPTSLLGRTLRHFYASFSSDQVAFNYGVNTANIQKFSLRFAAAHRVEDVAYWVRPLSPTPLRRRRWPFGRYDVEETRTTDDEWDDLLVRASASYPALVRRDQTYVRWRYLAAPDGGFRLLAARSRRGRLVGWAAFRRLGAELVWGDALVEPEHAASMRSLLAAAIAAAAPDDATAPPARIAGWFSPRPGWWLAALRELGFERRPQPQDLGLMCVPFLLPDAPALLARSYWTQGDSDLF
jgi:hypothetical protein